MRENILILEDSEAKYEIYMQSVERSNVDSTIVGWELRYDYICKFSTGCSVTHGNRMNESFESFVSHALMHGMQIVK